MPRKTVRTKKQIEVRKRALKRWSIGIVCALVVLFIAITIMLNQPFMRIGEIMVTGNETVHTDDITEAVTEAISGKTFWVFPHDTVPFIKRSQVRSLIEEYFPRIKTARISIQNFDILTLRVAEHEPEFLWCNELVTDGPSTCYYMDQTSYIFSEAPYFTDNVYLKFTGTHFDLVDGPLRATVFDIDAIEQVLELRNLLYEGGVVVNKIAAKEYGDYELYLDTVDGSRLGPESRLIINLATTNTRILEDLQIAFSTEGFREKLETYPERLQYIDLRFSDKIVYRFQTGTPDISPAVNTEVVPE